jgi:hypothetical protein
MPELEESKLVRNETAAPLLPITVIVAARNEARNLPRCLESLRDAGEVYVVDSQSTDGTVEIAQARGAHVVQFHYQGGWPKKRQWALESLPLAYDWVFLVDADEALTPELAREIQEAVQNPDCDGYYIALRMFFLGRELRHSGASFYKLSLFRRGKGRFECRLKDQDRSMADMEVHEHIVLEADGMPGRTARLQHPLLHHNVESLSHYIRKHDEYVAGRQRQCQGTGSLILWITSAETPMAAEEVLFDPGLARAFLFFQIHFLSRISRRRSRVDLLRYAGRAVLPHQSQDLRTESARRGAKELIKANVWN